MSGGLFVRAAARELGHDINVAAAEALQRRHGELFREFLPERRPLPGAVELLKDLRDRNIAYGIAPRRRLEFSLARSAIPYAMFRSRKSFNSSTAPGKRAPLGEKFAEQLAVASLQRFRCRHVDVVPEFPCRRAHEQAATHTDAAVNTPTVNCKAGFHKSALPGKHVRIDGVHESAIEIKNQCAHDSIRLGGDSQLG